MRWIAPLPLTLLIAMTLPSLLRAQIITAQPARPVSPLPTYPRSYPSGSPSAFNPTYSAGYPYATSAGSSASSSAGSSQTSLLQTPEANTIRGWYRDYLGRDVGQDVAALVNLLRGGMAPIDLQATILGSDEFYSQKGRDPQLFVRETLQAVNWAEPSYVEVERWTNRLAQLRNDRFALAREILLGTSQTPSPIDQLGDLASRLPAAARLAVDTINFEIGGTTQGRQANLQAVALLDATNRLQRGAAAGSSRPTDAITAIDNADRTLLALLNTLSNPPGTAPSASGIVRRIGTMLAEARVALGPEVTPPRPNYPPPSETSPGSQGPSSWQTAEQVASARRAAESLIQTLTSQAYQDYAYNIVLRDLDTLASRLAGLETLVRSGASRERLSWEVQSVSDSTERVQTQLGAGRLPYAARLYWQSLYSSVAQLREAISAPNADGSTTMLRPTAWHESLLPLLDQAAAQIDVFLAGTTPLVYAIAEVPSVQADARSLKNRVMLMRQQAGYGQPASALKQTLSGMVGDYQDAFDRWNRIVASSRLPGPARLSPVGETLNRVEQIINNGLASGDVTPSGPTRMSHELSQLNAEVTDARRALVGLTGYQEQQALELYLEQLAGYVQQLEGALARQSSAEARRLAVGMQGVVGRMQVDTETLSRRVGSAGNLRQQASDLHFRADRMGRLVDDIEGQLY